MNKQSFFPMDNDIALSLLTEFIKPGSPSLSGMFGWHQPDENDTITVGSIYAACHEKPTLRELLIDSEMGYTVAKDLIKLAKNNDDSITLDTELEFTGLYCKEHISFKWETLEEEEKVLYRLAILFINLCGIPGHEFAVYYLEYLAYQYYREDESGWNIYTNDSNDFMDEILGEILDWNRPDLNYLFHGSYNLDNQSGEYHYYAMNEFKEERLNLEILEWLQELENDFDYGEGENRDIIFEVFEEEISWNYKREEIIPVLVYAIEFIQSAWNNGDLRLTSSDEMPKDVKGFIEQYESQMILPGLINDEQ